MSFKRTNLNFLIGTSEEKHTKLITCPGGWNGL